MERAKNMGIWMDHANAHLMEFTTDPIEVHIFTSRSTYQEKHETLNKGESHMHNKDQHQEAAYYKQLADEIIQVGCLPEPGQVKDVWSVAVAADRRER